MREVRATILCQSRVEVRWRLREIQMAREASVASGAIRRMGARSHSGCGEEETQVITTVDFAALQLSSIARAKILKLFATDRCPQ
jgi:hypothetical protein